jgi:hypothetical protein
VKGLLGAGAALGGAGLPKVTVPNGFLISLIRNNFNNHEGVKSLSEKGKKWKVTYPKVTWGKAETIVVIKPTSMVDWSMIVGLTRVAKERLFVFG